VNGRRGGTIVIGAGIIGTAVAAYLAHAGEPVTAIDRTGVCEETSAGNAAAFAFSDILPLAQKGMIRNLPRWLADPLGPLAIPPAYFPRLIPWLVRFLLAGRIGRRRRALATQIALMRLADREWEDLVSLCAARPMLREDGSLELYESTAEFSASLPGWEERAEAGIGFHHVQGSELSELQPGLSSRFVAGTFVPRWKNASDPRKLGQTIFEFARRNGCSLIQEDVSAVRADDEGVQVTLAGGHEISAANVVIAAGAWSNRLTRQFGESVPLETERGYNTTLPGDAFDLRRQLIFSAHGFVIVPLENAIRVGGAVELGGLDRPPDFRRAKAMLAKAKLFLPELNTDGGREWMGFRPSMPDSLPVIGRSSQHKNVFYAFGHGHLGLTQAAATGRLIRDLVFGQTPAIELEAFSPQRFRGQWRAIHSFA
jgi:D-amino-acid dehydrogenase